MKMKTVLRVLASIALSVVLASCTPGYVCPLKAGPGTCSSEQSAYRATLHHKADGLSIFNSSSNSQGDNNDSL